MGTLRLDFHQLHLSFLIQKLLSANDSLSGGNDIQKLVVRRLQELENMVDALDAATVENVDTGEKKASEPKYADMVVEAMDNIFDEIDHLLKL